MAATTLKEAVIQALNKAANAFYSPQTLTPEQQEQARTNIGAMSAATSSIVPAGTLLPFAGTAVPDGYLLCNGAEVSRTDYANLFAAIGTKWGEGDGSTTFTLPDFNDRFIEGTTDTERVGQYLEAGAPNISGYFGSVVKGNIESNKVQPIATGAFVDVGSIGSKTYKAAASNEPFWRGTNFSASNSNENFGNSDSIQPSSGYALTIIKA